MILHGYKKRVLKDIIRYYVDTTGSAYENFILSVQKTRARITEGMPYQEWLAVKCFEILSKNEITLSDCIENKDIIRSAIAEDDSRNQGEFYTPEAWAKEGVDYLKKMLGDLWGEAYIWEASCGSGNLVKALEGYPRDKIFMSTLLEEDIDMVKTIFPDVTAFKLDFVNGIDYDDRNLGFSEKLPEKLLDVLRNNKPLIFFMNPPYKVMDSKSSDVGAYMSSLGMARDALDIFHQFMYRICMIKRFYGLTNLYLGIYGPLTMFHSKMIENLYNEFKRDFVFVDGMCFDASVFSSTSESVEWVVGYTTWRTKKEGEEDRSMILDAKAEDAEGNIKIIGKRLVTALDEYLHTWCMPKDVTRYTTVPVVTNMMNFTGSTYKFPPHGLGCMMSSKYGIRGIRRAAITTLPNPGGVDITEENFWRIVASYGARRSYGARSNPYNNCQYFAKPDTKVEGYEQWLTDALVLFLFDYDSQQASYRGVEVEGKVWDFQNAFFPISEDIVRSVVTDTVILEDLEKFPPRNQFIMNIIAEKQHNFSPEAKDLYVFCLELILKSLEGTVRKDAGYPYWTNAWDAGMIQVRYIDGLMTPELEERYSYLVLRLKDKLLEGVYKYGFMMDTALSFDVEGINDDIEDDDSDEVEECEENGNSLI